MIYKKKVSVGQFLKKGQDIKDGDLLTIANEGKSVEGEFGTQQVFLVKLSDGREGNISINQTSINGFIDAFGQDSVNWIGKQVKASKIKQNVSGKFIDVWYFSHPEAEMGENGFTLNKEFKPSLIGDVEITSEDIPFNKTLSKV